MTGTTEPELGAVHRPLALVLMAAGSSARFGGTKKEFTIMRRGGQQGAVLSFAALPFLQEATPQVLCVTHAPGLRDQTVRALLSLGAVQELVERHGIPVVAVQGGSSRQESVLNALRYLDAHYDLHDAVVAIHDGARPFLTGQLARRVITAAQDGAAVPCVSPVDTCKVLGGEATTIRAHLERKTLGAVQTPQAFLFDRLLQCHLRAAGQQKEYTDDSEIWDAFPDIPGGSAVQAVAGEQENKKITYASDAPDKPTAPNLRIGLGSDVHRLVAGRKLVVGGVHVPYDKGEEAHSDGDALLHAITDAVLGAAALGDIGSYFSPSDPRWKDADSAGLLAAAWADVTAAGWSLVNLDCVVELEAPKLLPFREDMRSRIAAILDAQGGQVFVKAKTGERLDAVGSGQAIRATATCLLCHTP